MKHYLPFIFIFLSFLAYSQVGINTLSPKAQLDIFASNPAAPEITDGILIPRISKFPAVKPGPDQHGMLVFLDKTVNEFAAGFYYWNQTSGTWKSLLNESASGNFYKTGTTQSPNTITDPIFRKGNTSIGTEESTAKLQIVLSATEDAALKRALVVDNKNPTVDNLASYGIINDNRSATNGLKYGFKNNVGGDGTGIHYGIFNETYQNSGTNDIYGMYNRVGRTYGARSTNYGIYSEIGSTTGQGIIYGIYSVAYGDSNSNVFAGYFAGRVGIGNTKAEEYILPASRGQEGQLLVTDANGLVSWTYNNSSNYSSTGSAAGNFIITDEMYTLRINNQVTGVTLPRASDYKGRMLILIGWPGISQKEIYFLGTDNLLDIATNTQISTINSGQVYKIQSATNRWILLDK